MSEKHPKHITLTATSPNSRILLRSPILSDAVNLTARVHDPLCIAHIPHFRSPTQPFTVEGTEKQIGIWRARSSISSLVLVIVLLASHDEPGREPVVIGDTGFQCFDWASKTGECGIMIDSGPAVRGKGLAKEAIEMSLAYGFDHLGLERIDFFTAEENKPMRGLLEKKFGISGWKREKKGDWGYSATREWWLGRKADGDVIEVEVEVMDD